MRVCNCIGPQDGQPLCPCMMRGVSIRDDRYVRETDLGPVQLRIRDMISPRIQGCICPVGAEKTCQGAMCPRKPIGSAASIASPTTQTGRG